ncbi:MAG: stage II sporulation protein M [Lactobacillales bacterium]|jgi:uncharacterized membrane protein SpoIIM required for sporulation|nr:stage II sporulation protein M [Lactobacillales bacterium]
MMTLKSNINIQEIKREFRRLTLVLLASFLVGGVVVFLFHKIGSDSRGTAAISDPIFDLSIGYVFYHNWIIAMILLIGIISRKTVTYVFLSIQGFIFGAQIISVALVGMPMLEVVIRLSHGMLEIPALLIMALAGTVVIKDKQALRLFALFVVVSSVLLWFAAVWEIKITPELWLMFVKGK